MRKILSTTATGAVNASLAGMAVDPAGNRYLAIFLQNNRTVPDPLIQPGRDLTRVIVGQKIAVEGKIADTAWLEGISDRGLRYKAERRW